MSAAIMEAQLAKAFAADAALRRRGLRAVVAADGGVEVTLGAGSVGVWRWQSGSFRFTAASDGRVAVEVETTAEAVLWTRERFMRA